MNTDLIKEIAKERYQREHDRKDQINNSLSIPIVVIMALIGVLGFFIINFPFRAIIDTPGVLIWIVFVLFGLALLGLIICLLIAICYLNKVFSGLTYAYIPTPKKIKKYTEELKEYYEETGEDEIEKMIEKDLEEFLIDEYCKNTEINIAKNKEKSFYLTKAKRFIILSLMLLVLNTIPFVILHYTEKIIIENIQKIRIIE
ncbi:unnamed protein product, partial [marine sediment metagenome]